MSNIREDEKCKTCFFYKLCVTTDLDHCEGLDYVPEERGS